MIKGSKKKNKMRVKIFTKAKKLINQAEKANKKGRGEYKIN